MQMAMTTSGQFIILQCKSYDDAKYVVFYFYEARYGMAAPFPINV